MQSELTDARLLIIEPGTFMARIMRSMLSDLGFANQEHYADTHTPLSALKQGRVDLILCDVAAAPLDGLSFIRRVRRGNAIHDPYVPILLTAFGASRGLVENARDAGATEVLVKPLAARALQEKIAVSLAKPRRFVRCSSYCGPDRRRRDDAAPGPERRGRTQLSSRRLTRDPIARLSAPV